MPSDDQIDAEGQAVLEHVLADQPDATNTKVHLRVCDGPPAQTLSYIADEPDVTTVVVGSRGHGGTTGLLLGSVSHTMTHHCSKPLVIIPPTLTPALASCARKRILVGVDGSEGAATALRWAADEARIRGVSLQVVVAWSEPPAVFGTKFPLAGSLPTPEPSVAGTGQIRADRRARHSVGP